MSKYITDAEVRERLDAAIKQYEGDAVADLLAAASRKIAELQSDKSYLIDQWNGVEGAFAAWPKLPTTQQLWAISGWGVYPGDWERGKLLQRELPMSRVPYKHEYECAAGFWDRITNGAWRDAESENSEQDK